MRHLLQYIAIFFLSAKIHLQSALEYKRAFIIQVLGMVLNNGSFLFFWWIIYHRFADSFQARDIAFSQIIMVWAIASAAFGLMHLLLGGSRHLSECIVNGKLDIYLLYPRQPLFMAAIAKAHVSAMGDLAYGYLLFFIFLPFGMKELLVFTTMVCLSALLLAGLLVILNCLTFFLGNAEQAKETFFASTINFATYPEGIFSPFIKFLLFSILPVGLYVYLPVRLLTAFSFKGLLLLVAGDCLVLALACLVFRLGLKHYESGNLFYVHK